MIFNRFAKNARATATHAERVALRLASPTVEAEHLLLALAEGPPAATQEALADAGLKPEELQEALADETDRSLASVGLSADAFYLSSFVDAAVRPKWGTSAKLALERSMKVAVRLGHSRIEPGHILLGVLQASIGTVPRALETAGVDRHDIVRRVEATLDHAGR